MLDACPGVAAAPECGETPFCGQDAQYGLDATEPGWSDGRYEESTPDGETIVTDTVSGRDGSDELTEIEILKFKDKIVK